MAVRVQLLAVQLQLKTIAWLVILALLFITTAGDPVGNANINQGRVCA